MLRYSEWLDEAKALTFGSSRRVQHCNHNNTMSIRHDEDGFHAYCFRCSEGGFKSHGMRRIRDVFAEREFAYAKDVTFPLGYTKEIPAWAAVWFLQYGITMEEAASYGVGWDEKMQRIILPVYDRTVNPPTLEVVQARAVITGVVPKYLNQQGNNKSKVLFKSNDQRHDMAVITEDILSCIRVGKVTAAVCPMGTTLSYAQAAHLLHFKEIVIWLDNDAAGHKGAIKMKKVLEPLVPTRIITGTADPKCYDKAGITKMLGL